MSYEVDDWYHDTGPDEAVPFDEELWDSLEVVSHWSSGWLLFPTDED